MAIKLLTHAEQVAAYLRGELLAGRWTRVMPGIQKLGIELGVNPNTLAAALELLEREGLLVAQGHGRPRRIGVAEEQVRPRALRVRMMLSEAADRMQRHHQGLISELKRAGFDAEFAGKSLRDLGMRLERVARYVAEHPADAWVVSAGSREVLAWFAEQRVPVMAMFGRYSELPIAAVSPLKTPAMQEAVGRLVGLGHRRIVLIVREDRRKPKPALFEQNFLNELELHGLPTGSYNLPDWHESPMGFRLLLRSLFRHTPPTALIIDEPDFLAGVMQFMARRGISMPERISLVCCDPAPAMAWCHPQIAHIRWDSQPLIKRVLRWVEGVAHGRNDRRQVMIHAEFVEGGTIGPSSKL